MSQKILVSEIFGPTLQGEGPYSGHKTAFVRLAGCDFRCRWCDTLYAVARAYDTEGRWTAMTEKEIFARLESLGAFDRHITISGGNPLLQNLSSFVREGKKKGYQFFVETQGSVFAPWVEDLDVLTLSPKPPSARVSQDFAPLKELYEYAGRKGVQRVLKVAVEDEEDFLYALALKDRLQSPLLYLQAVNSAPVRPDFDAEDSRARLRWLAHRALQSRREGLVVLPQLHLYLWGLERGR